jgi:MscS family membrane protein
MALYEVLNRIELPPFDQIPGSGQLDRLSGTNQQRWVIPHTEIVLVRATSGLQEGDFLFSGETVDRAEEFYQRVRELPYIRNVPVKNLYQSRITAGGWMVPLSWTENMPGWLLGSIAGQATWKWVALVLLLLVGSVVVRTTHRLSTTVGNGRPFLNAVVKLLMPVLFLVATPVISYFALVQINFIGEVAGAIGVVATAVVFLSGAWLCWRASHVVAEAIIASPSIAPESIDAHLIRICTRLFGLLAAAGSLSIGADQIGIPVYGIIAGLGVGGLAIALAAQPTIENLIGSLNLFVDKPIRVGDFCKFGDGVGTVESIGIRSTRIRGLDRTITTIPNGALSKMSLVNYTIRDRLLIRIIVGVRCDTSAEQLRFVVAKLREMLLGHPRIFSDSARARLIGLGSSSRDIEVVAYVMTRDWSEFLAIQEDVLLRIIDIVQQSGTAFALPSQTLYLSRDSGLDTERATLAEAQVRHWRDEGQLPFPNFTVEQIAQIRGSVVYPPKGSVMAPTETVRKKVSRELSGPEKR